MIIGPPPKFHGTRDILRSSRNQRFTKCGHDVRPAAERVGAIARIKSRIPECLAPTPPRRSRVTKCGRPERRSRTPEKYGNDRDTSRAPDPPDASRKCSTTADVDPAASLQAGGPGLDSRRRRRRCLAVLCRIDLYGSRRAFGARSLPLPCRACGLRPFRARRCSGPASWFETRRLDHCRDRRASVHGIVHREKRRRW
jgi:hypothetical protein